MTQSLTATSGAAVRSAAQNCVAASGVSNATKGRRAPRVAHRASCRVSLPEVAPAFAIAGETRDISREGLSVVLPQTLPAGVLLEAQFFAPDGTPSTLRGRVVYCRRVLAEQFELGISLVDGGGEKTRDVTVQ